MDVLGDRVLELGPKPNTDGPYKNFKLTRDSDGVAWLLFDREGVSANTLSADLIEELDKVLAELESQRPTGLVIRSAKKSGFIAGADVNAFRGATDPGAVEFEIGRAHAVINRLEELRVPTVAVIHGFCLGGGLEVALACQMRIAIEDARFGFPEVMLGLHPGLGGTARFTQLVNPMQAMPLMLTGNIGQPGAGSHTWAGNYKAALFQGSAWAGPGFKGWVAEDPFHLNLNESAHGKEIHAHP